MSHQTNQMSFFVASTSSCACPPLQIFHNYCPLLNFFSTSNYQTFFLTFLPIFIFFVPWETFDIITNPFSTGTFSRPKLLYLFALCKLFSFSSSRHSASGPIDLKLLETGWQVRHSPKPSSSNSAPVLYCYTHVIVSRIIFKCCVVQVLFLCIL